MAAYLIRSLLLILQSGHFDVLRVECFCFSSTSLPNEARGLEASQLVAYQLYTPLIRSCCKEPLIGYWHGGAGFNGLSVIKWSRCILTGRHRSHRWECCRRYPNRTPRAPSPPHFGATTLTQSTSVPMVRPRVWDSRTAASPTTKVISGKIDVSAGSVTPPFTPPDQTLTNMSAAPSSRELETLPASK